MVRFHSSLKKNQLEVNPTGQKPVPNPPQLIRPEAPVEIPAEVAYIYPNKLIQDEPKIISVRVSVNNSGNEAKDNVKKIEAYSDSAGVANNRYTVDVTPIGIYDSLTITIDDPAGDFKIDSIIGYSQKQKVDLKNGTVWQWSISSHSDKPKGKLYINVIPSPGSLPRLPVKIIEINIGMESALTRVRSYTDYILDPKILITSILIPVFGYLGKRYFDKKKRGKNIEAS